MSENKNMRELSLEDLDKITGGSIFDTINNAVKNTLKDVGNWMYDNFIDPAVDGLVDAGKTVVDVAYEGLGIHSGKSLSLTAPAKKD